MSTLKNADIRYHIQFVGVLVYAGDIVLLTPKSDALRSILEFFDGHGNSFNNVLNAKKSKCVIFVRPGASPTITLVISLKLI